MVNDFKFFSGYIKQSYIIGVDPAIHDVEVQLRRCLSQEISDEIDREVINRLRDMGNENAVYLNHWMNMGNRA